MSTVDLKSFHYLENGEISFSMLDTIKTENILDSGVYSIAFLEYPENRVQVKVSTDKETVKMHDFPDKVKLDNLINVFFNEKVTTKMASLGFNHKVGVLLYGKEGTGKSTIIKNYANRIVNEYNGIVFYVSSVRGLANCWDFIHKIRAIQKNPIVVIFEEMDSYVSDTSEGHLKTIFDGNLSIDNCFILGSTNYIDKIPNAIKNRPSRFKYVLNIEGIQSEEEIFIILNTMIGDLFSTKELKQFSKELKGSSLDFIKQFGVDKIMDLETYSHRTNKSIGFSVEQK